MRIDLSVLFTCLVLPAALTNEALIQTEAEVEAAEALEASALRVELLQQKRAVGATGIISAAEGAYVHTCRAHQDCCGESEGNKSNCEWFCRPIKDEEGVCSRKWPGFCLEDEDCGSGELCDRQDWAYAGICHADGLCQNVACGPGSCLEGKCLCPYGFAGARCERSTEAFAFVFHGNSTADLVSARVLVKSLHQRIAHSARRAHGNSSNSSNSSRHGAAPAAVRDIVAIVPQSLASSTPIAFLDLLRADGVRVRFVEDLPTAKRMKKAWLPALGQLAAFGLAEYSRVALLDAAAVFDVGAEDPGKVFADCTEEMCAVMDNASESFEGGMIVLTPSQQRLAHVMQALERERHHYEAPERFFLARYVGDEKNGVRLGYLDERWSGCVGGGGSHNMGYASSGFNLLRACGKPKKLASIRRCAGACDPDKKRHAVLVLQHYHGMVDGCFAKYEEAGCLAVGCSWCGSYCSDRRVPCSAELFAQEDQFQPGAEDNREALRACRNKHKEVKQHEEPWADMPAGWWAWPHVGVYQVLVDRFASPSPHPCPSLNDYCGGTFSALQGKLGYVTDLGVDGVMMNPVIKNMPKGYHGYWTLDLDQINGHFGTEDDLKELVLAAHGAGVKVMADVNLNHAGKVLEDIPQIKPFGKAEYYHSENISCYSKEDFARELTYVERCQLWGLPDYKHEHPAVWSGLLNWLRGHVDMYGFDGVRVDAARHIPRSFLNRIRDVGAPIPAFHEVIKEDANLLTSYATDDHSAIYNYPLYFRIRDVFQPGPEQRPMTHLGKIVLQEELRGKLLLNFLDNNDLIRFVEVVDGDLALYRNALLVMAGTEGVPVILYGAEQDLPGGGEAPFPDRPVLWQKGYNKTGPTFLLLQRVLWLRKRYGGLHQFRPQVVHADHKWLVFTRGPVLFVTTNAGNQSSYAQRVLWENITTECHAVKLCNLLSPRDGEDCVDVEPGRPTHIELINGVPKLYVPASVVQEYHSSEPLQADLPQSGSRKSTFEALPPSHWRRMPGAPSVHLEMLPRFRRPVVDMVKGFADDKKWLPLTSAPPHLDLWHPPVGAPALHVARARLERACLHSDAHGHVAVLAQRGPKTFALCPDDSAKCIGHDSPLEELPELVNGTAILYLTFLRAPRRPRGLRYFNFLIESLPAIVPFLPRLRAGTMQVFLDGRGRELVAPVLQQLGVRASAVLAPLSPQDHYCAPELHFEARSDRGFIVPARLRALRRELHLPPAPDAASRRTVAVLAGKEGTWHLQNLQELLATLPQLLGVTVELVDAPPENATALTKVLSHTAVLLGVHGAHMTSMLYAPIGAKVIEIIPQAASSAGNQHYRSLAGALDFTYVPVVGMVDAPSDPEQAVYGGNVTVNLQEITPLVKRLLSSSEP